MNKKLIFIVVNAFSLLCALLLFVATMKVPREYYWLLRAVVFTGALLVLFKNRKYFFWAMLFGLIAILFNPIFPIYFYKKMYWVPLDILTGLLFLLEVALNRPKKVEPLAKTKNIPITYKRDRII